MSQIIGYEKGMLEQNFTHTEFCEITMKYADPECSCLFGKIGVHCELPHSCDGWVVGNVEQAKLLVADLLRFIIKAEEKK